MAKKNIFTQRRKIAQEAENWFDRIDDQVSFEAFANEQEKAGTGNEMLHAIRHQIKRRQLNQLWRRVAAAVIVISVATLVYQGYRSSNATSVAQVWKSYVAQKGEFKKILLPDSSVVHLRPGAKIYVSHPFQQQIRRVKLAVGEAYFEVSHDAAHPFLVTAGQITTAVLGTKFIINNEPSLDGIRVALLSGKVAVRSKKASLGVLLPHQQLSFNPTTGKAKLENNNAYTSEKWLKGEYILENVTLKSFAQSFGNAFSKEVRFDHQDLEKLHISILFNRADAPKAILDQLKLIHGLHYKIKDKEVILMK